jgi:opacity protein-like surface antigen
MRLAIPVAVLLITASTFVPASHAANAGLGLGVHGGYGQSSDADNGSFLAGAHATLNLTSWLGAVAMVDYKFDEDFTVDGEDIKVKSFPLALMGRFYLPVEKSWSPYVAAGVQYRFVSYSGDVFDDLDLDTSDSAFGWLLGAGIEFSPSDNWEWFVEGRFESADPESDFDNAVQDAKDLNYDQWNARVGLTWFLN